MTGVVLFIYFSLVIKNFKRLSFGYFTTHFSFVQWALFGNFTFSFLTCFCPWSFLFYFPRCILGHVSWLVFWFICGLFVFLWGMCDIVWFFFLPSCLSSSLFPVSHSIVHPFFFLVLVFIQIVFLLSRNSCGFFFSLNGHVCNYVVKNEI